MGLLTAGVVGAATGLAGGAAASAVGGALPSGVNSPIIDQAILGAMSGAAGGAAGGGVAAVMTGGDFWNGAWQGATSGAIAGGVSAGAMAAAKGAPLFRGSVLDNERGSLNFNGTAPNDKGTIGENYGDGLIRKIYNPDRMFRHPQLDVDGGTLIPDYMIMKGTRIDIIETKYGPAADLNTNQRQLAPLINTDSPVQPLDVAIAKYTGGSFTARHITLYLNNNGQIYKYRIRVINGRF